MRLSFLGGASEVGASCLLVKIGDKNLVIDCGIRQSVNVDPLPDFKSIQDLGGCDAIIISHAHMDHTGALPLLSKAFPYAKIYMNNMTKDLVRVLLKDSLKIMNNREAEIPLYSEIDVENMLDRIVGVNYLREVEIIDGIKLCFYQAGHIAGAGSIYIVSQEGALFYSGDFSLFDQNSISGAKIPRLRPDIAILESTYGDRLHSNRQVEEERLITIVEQCIQENGKMLIPAFALGRAQEVILILKRAINKGRIKKYNIYIDGMIKDINRMYKLNPLYLKSGLAKKILRGMEPFYDDNIRPVETKEARDEILNSKDGCVIISSSGMLTGGPSQSYAEKIVSMESGYIVITGYQDEESPGRKLLQLLNCEENERTVEINGKVLPVRCKVEKVGLSAHSDKTEIYALAELLHPKHLILVHGEQAIIKNLAKEMSMDHGYRVHTPILGENIDIYVNNPRKQLNKELPAKMFEREVLTEENMENLWGFILDNYGQKFFTVEEIITVWNGKQHLEDEEIENTQKILSKGLYFENDLRRFYMFKARSREEVLEDLQPKELKQNEIYNLAEQYFQQYNYKKIGLLLDQKVVKLNFDFPKIVDKSIIDKMQEFQNFAGWKVEINKQSNFNEAEIMIRALLNEYEINKISLHAVEGKYNVQLENSIGDFREVKDKFYKATGLILVINSRESDSKICEISTLENESIKGTIFLEQNQALTYIDEQFKDEAFKPYKKSIKGNRNLELSFISPKVGERYKDKLNKIETYIGWSIAISNKINQNEIINLALRLCREKEIQLKKNPSYNPFDTSVMIYLKKIDDSEKMMKIKEEFQYCTECLLLWS